MLSVALPILETLGTAAVLANHLSGFQLMQGVKSLLQQRLVAMLVASRVLAAEVSEQSPVPRLPHPVIGAQSS